MAFPGATATREEAAYVILGAPLDVSTTFQPGCRFGPQQLRWIAESFEDYDHETDRAFSACGVHDAGDVRAWDDAEEYLAFLEGEIRDIVMESAVPLVLGGEHTVTVAGVRAVAPDVVVSVDAHLDLRPEFAGNPLSHATVMHHAARDADEVVILGARSGSEAEWERVSRGDVHVIPPADVGDWSPAYSMEDSVYLSVDIDAADPGVAPGTGTLEPGGLTARELRAVVRSVAPVASGFDVTEVNDRDAGQTAALGAKLLRDFVYTHAAHNAR